MGVEQKIIDTPYISFALPQVREARRLLNDGCVNHNGGSESIPLAAFLYPAGAPDGVLEDLINDSGGLAEYKGEMEQDIWSLSYEDFAALLYRRMQRVYSHNELSLSNGYEYGFNGHGLDDHVHGFVLPRADALLSQHASIHRIRGEELEIMRKVNAAAVIAHDSGNLLTRKGHPFIGYQILALRVPELKSIRVSEELDEFTKESIKRHNRRVRSIRRAVMLHDEKSAEAFSSHMSGDEMLQSVGPVALALLAADKSDAFDSRRTPTKEVDPKEAVENDRFIETCGLVVSNKPEICGQMAVRRVNFSPVVNDDAPIQVGLYCVDKKGKNGESRRRFWVSNDMYQIYEEKNIPWSLLWFRQAVQLNLSRIHLEARSMFALFPELKTYRLEIHDENTWSEDGTGLTIGLDLARDYLDSDISYLRKFYASDCIPDVYVRMRDYWRDRIRKENLTVDMTEGKDGYHYRSFEDHDGDRLIIDYTFSCIGKRCEDFATYLNHLFMNRSERRQKNGAK